MLFRKKMPRACSYCQYAAKINEEQILCMKKGVRPSYSSCRKFQYDPCKRIPPRPRTPDFSKYNNDDFSL